MWPILGLKRDSTPPLEVSDYRVYEVVSRLRGWCGRAAPMLYYGLRIREYGRIRNKVRHPQLKRAELRTKERKSRNVYIRRLG